MTIVVTNSGKVTIVEGSGVTTVVDCPNMLASQDNPPPVYEWSGVDVTCPTGWTSSEHGYGRMRSGNNAYGNLPSPSGSPYYNKIQGSGRFMTTIVGNLLIGRPYQLSGFMSSRPDFDPSVLEIKVDGVVILHTGPLGAGFVAFGPITVIATATSHTLGFFNASDVGDRTVLIDGLSLK